MDIQPVFNEYKAVAYLSSNFSKSEDQCSQTIKDAANETFKDNFYHYEIMKENNPTSLLK